jgi:hypothetical protein
LEIILDGVTWGDDKQLWIDLFNPHEWVNGSLSEDVFHLVAAFEVAMAKGVNGNEPHWA